MKPLSAKTLVKKYEESGLSDEKISLLYDYYNSISYFSFIFDYA